MASEAENSVLQDEWLQSLPAELSDEIEKIELHDPAAIRFNSASPSSATNGMTEAVWRNFLDGQGTFQGKFARIFS